MHELTLQVRALRQCLSQVKAPVAFFLGAGCPLSIRVPGKGGVEVSLIPDITGLTSRVAEALGKNKDLKKEFKTLSDQLPKDANIEQVLSHLRSLLTVALGDAEVRGLKREDLDKLEIEICDQIYQQTNKALPNDQTPYQSLALWIRAASRNLPIEIFTPNYDLLIEEALDAARVPYFDGFIGAFQPFFDTYAMEQDRLPNRWVRLWKVHGSINWALKAKPGYPDGLVTRSDPKLIDRSERRLIHPSHLKYDESRRMPYLAMIDRLKSFLRTPSCRLITCGYSFSDTHINEVFKQGLDWNPSAQAFGLIYSELEKHEKAKILAESSSNLTLLAWDKGVVGTRTFAYSSKAQSDIRNDEPSAIAWEAPKQETGKGAATPTADPVMLGSYSLLGNFAKLGDFLKEMIGEQDSP